MKTLQSVLLAALATFALPARADWSDDFNGGLHQPWVFLDDGGSSPPDATFADSANDALHLEADFGAAAMGNVDQFAVGVVGLANPAPFTFTDVRATATVQAFNTLTLGGAVANSNNDAFIFVRVQGPPTLASYLLNVDFANGAVDLVHVVNPATLVSLDEATLPVFDPTASYKLELTAIGTELTGNVYSNTDVLLATVAASHGALTSGLSGVGAALNSDLPQADITLLAVAFDDVSSQAILEPSSLALAGVAAAMLARAVIRKRRRAGV